MSWRSLNPQRLGVPLVMLLIAGCAADHSKPAAVSLAAQGAGYTAVQTTVATPRGEWWRHDLAPGPGAALATVLTKNPALQAERAALKVARAALDEAEAERWPDIDLALREAVDKTDNDIDGSRRVALDITVPIDLFGRLRGARDAAAFDLAAAIARLANTRADTVVDFLLAVTDATHARARQHLLEQQSDAARTLLELTRLRFSQGQASIVDVLQQQELLASLTQQLPATNSAERSALNTLARLGGVTPAAQAPAWLPADLDFIKAREAVLPAPLLLHTRADLVAARARLAAQDRRYETALLDYLPKLTLNGSTVARIVDGNATALISTMLDAVWRLFDSGARDAVAAAERARLERQGALLLQAWVNAVNEVDTLLNEQQQRAQQITLSANRLAVAQQLLAAARQRYARGITDYLPVLAALRTLQTQQSSHLDLQAAQLATVIRLRHAQGTLPYHDTQHH